VPATAVSSTRKVAPCREVSAPPSATWSFSEPYTKIRIHSKLLQLAEYLRRPQNRDFSRILKLASRRGWPCDKTTFGRWSSGTFRT